MRKSTTTTTTRAEGAPTLSDVQRRALALAEAHRWPVAVEAADGTRVTLRQGRPGYQLVLYLGAPAEGGPRGRS